MAASYDNQTAVSRATRDIEQALDAIRGITETQTATVERLSAAHRAKIARAEAAALKAVNHLNDVYDDVCR